MYYKVSLSKYFKYIDLKTVGTSSIVIEDSKGTESRYYPPSVMHYDSVEHTLLLF